MMARKLAAITLSAAVLGGCTAQDFADLPKDAKERAMLCARAGVMLIGMTPSEDKPRFDRLGEKVRKLSNANHFYELFPEGNTNPAKVLGDEATIQGAVGSHWLSTVNTCFRAYGMEEEPVAALPQLAYQRTIACAASIAYDSLGGQQLNPQARVAYDPQAGYFIHKAAVLAGGADQLVKASDDATTQFQTALQTGMARAWAEQCKREDPKAVSPQATLPDDPQIALLACDDVLGFTMEGGLSVNAAQSGSARRYAAAYRTVHAQLATSPARDNKPAIEAAVESVAGAGRLDGIADACIARFAR